MNWKNRSGSPPPGSTLTRNIGRMSGCKRKWWYPDFKSNVKRLSRGLDTAADPASVPSLINPASKCADRCEKSEPDRFFCRLRLPSQTPGSCTSMLSPRPSSALCRTPAQPLVYRPPGECHVILSGADLLQPERCNGSRRYVPNPIPECLAFPAINTQFVPPPGMAHWAIPSRRRVHASSKSPDHLGVRRPLLQRRAAASRPTNREYCCGSKSGGPTAHLPIPGLCCGSRETSPCRHFSSWQQPHLPCAYRLALPLSRPRRHYGGPPRHRDQHAASWLHGSRAVSTSAAMSVRCKTQHAAAQIATNDRVARGAGPEDTEAGDDAVRWSPAATAPRGYYICCAWVQVRDKDVIDPSS
jgi:hypothetical protein